jgi:hypothetical protein
VHHLAANDHILPAHPTLPAPLAEVLTFVCVCVRSCRSGGVSSAADARPAVQGVAAGAAAALRRLDATTTGQAQHMVSPQHRGRRPHQRFIIMSIIMIDMISKGEAPPAFLSW